MTRLPFAGLQIADIPRQGGCALLCIALALGCIGHLSSDSRYDSYSTPPSSSVYVSPSRHGVTISHRSCRGSSKTKYTCISLFTRLGDPLLERLPSFANSQRQFAGCLSHQEGSCIRGQPIILTSTLHTDNSALLKGGRRQSDDTGTIPPVRYQY